MKKEKQKPQQFFNQFMFEEIGKVLNEISDIGRILKDHGGAHLHTDLLPQFKALCEKVKELESRKSTGPAYRQT